MEDITARVGEALVGIGITGLFVSFWWARKQVRLDVERRRQWGAALYPDEGRRRAWHRR